MRWLCGCEIIMPDTTQNNVFFCAFITTQSRHVDKWSRHDFVEKQTALLAAHVKCTLKVTNTIPLPGENHFQNAFVICVHFECQESLCNQKAQVIY